MKTALVLLFAALVVLIPFRVKAAQTSQRVPIAPGPQQGFRINDGGVPSGYMILGETDVPPPGYTYSGISLPTDPGAPDTPTWTVASTMLVARRELAAASVNGKVYAIGGYNAGYLSSVEAYSPESDTWTFRTPMPTARARIAAVVVGQLVYVIGGYDGAYLGTVEVYDPTTDTWSSRTSMPTARGLLTAVVVDGKVLAMGGHNGGALNVVEEYDPVLDSWNTLPSLPGVNSEGAAAVFNGSVYVVGGDNGFQPNQSIMAYDLGTATWSTRPGPSTYDHAVAVLGGALYSFGGVYGGTFVFNAPVTAWSAFDPMPTPRSTLAAAVLGNSVYLIGGQTSAPTAAVEVLSLPGRLYAHRRN